MFGLMNFIATSGNPSYLELIPHFHYADFTVMGNDKHSVALAFLCKQLG